MSKRVVISLLLALAALVVGGCYNFHVVEEGKVYRSAQGFSEDLAPRILRYGIKTVLKLNGGKPGEFWYDQTAAAVREADIKLIHLPMSAQRYPTKRELEKLVAALESAEYPLLIHCREGADRTGLASAACLLMHGEGLSAARDQLRFIPYGHTGLFGTARLDEVLDLYEPWKPQMNFAEWARTRYAPPLADANFDEVLASERAAAQAGVALPVAPAAR
jgi:protein tyrosine/serine phosphatase